MLVSSNLQIACADLTRGGHPALWLVTWDPSQPTATRPLAIQKDGTWFTYGYDITKNICEVFGPAGYIRTAYSYAPFGNVTESGDVSQPFQWSSEVYDSELDLVYYNYRHYSPVLGRFLSRAPIQEQGGLNLYAYARNNAPTFFDSRGQDCCASSLVDDLKKYEGYRSYVYKDTKGKKTIGYGFNIDDATTRDAIRAQGIDVNALASGRRGLSHEESNKILKYLSDVATREAHKMLGKSCIEKIGICALKIVSNMIYQMGYGRVFGFKNMRAALCSSSCVNFEKIAKEMLDSNWARRDAPSRAKELADCMSNMAIYYIPAR